MSLQFSLSLSVLNKHFLWHLNPLNANPAYIPYLYLAGTVFFYQTCPQQHNTKYDIRYVSL